MLQLQNIEEKKSQLDRCNAWVFQNSANSFREFIKKITVESFRHIENLELEFEHPVTVIAGTNKIGKTSILLLLACSFEQFMKADSTSPAGEIREHAWKDVLSFTAHETASNDYSYQLEWRVGMQNRSGEGKPLASSKAWSGLGKKSADLSRIKAKIRDREVRLIDLERILPGRSFSNALFRKANEAEIVRVDEEVEQAFSYIFDDSPVQIYEAGRHINKTCFLISHGQAYDDYSSFNAASGEEAVIYLLQDILGVPRNSLILIDEIEAGFHPSVQRKLADLITYVSWRDKKQFIITTHSSTFLSSFPPKSRRFLELVGGRYRSIARISHQAVRSKMDSIGHPIMHCYCEDDLAAFLIQKAMARVSEEHPHFSRLVNLIKSGPINEVKNDYVRHKRNFSQYRNKIGYGAVFDGDHKDYPEYSSYVGNEDENVIFLYPYDAPEKFLVRAFLSQNQHAQLRSALDHNDHHSLFQQMVDFGIAADVADARGQCYAAFENSPEFTKHYADLRDFLVCTVRTFSEMPE